MYKLVFVIAMMVVWLTVHLLQVEEEMAMKTLFQGKRAINRAAHAAAQQIDKVSLAEGIMRIDSTLASDEASRYLQANLLLDESGKPLEHSFLEHPVEVVVFEIINSDRSFPFYYRNDTYDFEVTLQRPGVILIAKIVYPRAFSIMGPIEWHIKGASELVMG
ncbi:hypothetical protein I6N90_20330 [Paenibacillus sp. GSMTC-2017]|uniref:hypothetical protein n=1 Tax=Paenibacillus sp. GSMTC-2017 TaxID=2794350 RepID=UPI0018D5F8CA|nr:hypothetical protein [Paenibacillus sp. GSMTC-2017]MBH5320156.1 hypothetical protein [Paenibacillus sp. GSMTC-2017]